MRATERERRIVLVINLTKVERRGVGGRYRVNKASDVKDETMMPRTLFRAEDCDLLF